MVVTIVSVALELEVVHSGAVLGPVAGGLGAAGAVRELRVPVRVARLWHEQHRVEVQGLPRPCHRVSVSHEPVVDFPCKKERYR